MELHRCLPVYIYICIFVGHISTTIINAVFTYRFTEKRDENFESLLTEINTYENSKSKFMREIRVFSNPLPENTKWPTFSRQLTETLPSINSTDKEGTDQVTAWHGRKPKHVLRGHSFNLHFKLWPWPHSRNPFLTRICLIASRHSLFHIVGWLHILHQDEKERNVQTLEVHRLEFVADVRTQFAWSQLAALIRRSAAA